MDNNTSTLLQVKLGAIRQQAITWVKVDQDPYRHMGHNELCSALVTAVLYFIIKTHVRGFFDTNLHEVSWHFATAEWVLSSTDRVKISVKEAIQNGFLFLSHT